MIYITHKMLVQILFKIHQNYPKDSSFECFIKEYNRFLEKLFFHNI